MAVQFYNLTKMYGGRPVLRGATWEISAGQVGAIFGNNGVGKSTLLGILSTTIRPDGGNFTVAGQQRPDAIRREIGFITHSPMLTPELTVRENLLVAAGLRGLHDREARPRIDRLAERLQIGDWLDRPAKTLSRGQAQRSAIAAAVLAEPPVLLLDEPFTGLDVTSVATLETLIGDWRARGRTVVLVTHDIPDGLRLADRVAVLVHGKVFEPPPHIRHDAGKIAAALTPAP